MKNGRSSNAYWWNAFRYAAFVARWGVTLKWLLSFLVQCFEALPDHLHVRPISYQHDVLIRLLEVEADELASFVQKKANTCPEGGCQGVFTDGQNHFARLCMSSEPRWVSAWR
jgi:hypothetical protein